MGARLARKLLILGWDAADWLLIDPLLAKGAMPNLKRLIDNGVRAELRTLEPTLSPLLWTSIATGKTPDKHGVLNFVEPDPTGDDIRTTSCTTRRTKALWNILTQEGMRVHALAWYASHPAEPINGVCVSNMFDRVEAPPAGQPWPAPEGAVHGDDKLRSKLVAARVNPNQSPATLLAPLLPNAAKFGNKDKRLHTLAKEWARAKSLHAGVLELLSHEKDAGRDWDCLMVFHDSIDYIGHHFMEFRPPRMDSVKKEDVDAFGQVMDRVYMRHDELLGELMKAVGADTTVMLVSDHGFYSDHRRPVLDQWRKEAGAAIEARWHRPEGVIILSGPGFAKGQTIAAPVLLDVTPTALVALGLAVGADMDGRVISEAFAQPPQIEVIPSWDDKPGEAGLHPAEMRLNPYEARDAIKQLVELGYMPDLGDNQKARLELTERETQFNLGTVFMTTARPKEAIPIFQQLVATKPDEPRYVIPLAQCQYAASDFAGAVATLRAYLAQGSNFVDARIMLAGALQAQGDVAEATKVIDELESEHGTRPMMALPLANLFAAQARWQKADQYFQGAVQLDPRNPHIRVSMARSALAQGAYERAAESCLDATELQMALPEAHYLLGVSLAWLGDLDNAYTSLMHSLTMRPGSVEALQFAAAVCQQRGDKPGNAKAEAELKHLSGGPQPARFPWDAKNWLESRQGSGPSGTRPGTL